MQREVEVELSIGRLQIDVQMHQLRRITLSGNSDLHAAGPIKSDQLTISISGAPRRQALRQRLQPRAGCEPALSSP